MRLLYWISRLYVFFFALLFTPLGKIPFVASLTSFGDEFTGVLMIAIFVLIVTSPPSTKRIQTLKSLSGTSLAVLVFFFCVFYFANPGWTGLGLILPGMLLVFSLFIEIILLLIAEYFAYITSKQKMGLVAPISFEGFVYNHRGLIFWIVALLIIGYVWYSIFGLHVP